MLASTTIYTVFSEKELTYGRSVCTRVSLLHLNEKSEINPDLTRSQLGCALQTFVVIWILRFISTFI
jgi:uncharacterized membrane protein